MGQNGTVTVSNLKTLTSIADDRVSAHHPDGAGSKTGMSYFFLTGFTDSDGGQFEDLAYNTGSCWQEPSGLNLDDINLQTGDQIRIGLRAASPPQHFHPDGPLDNNAPPVDSAGDLVVLKATFDSIRPNKERNVTRDQWYVTEDTNLGAITSNGDEVLVQQYTIDGNPVEVSGIWEDGGYNSDMDNYNSLFARTINVGDALSIGFQVSQPDSTSADVVCDWQIDGGATPYNFDLFRKKASEADSQYSVIDNHSYSNKPVDDSHTDTTTSAGNDYEYKARVIDDNADEEFVEETIIVNVTT